MSLSTKDFLRRLRFRILEEPAGMGRPSPKEVFDREYTHGKWHQFQELPELARQSVVAGTICLLHARGKVLDLGCGSGLLASLLQPHQVEYTGVDLSSAALKIAKSRQLSKCTFIEANFESWKPDHSFDSIVFSECIGYAIDPGRLVSGFLPYLAPEGHIIVSYLRSRFWRAQWRRIERFASVLEHTTISRKGGQTWDIKVLVPKS
jgi:2-polyprenyl-6-hydroxyphenyl methylase/3-demethylubiquinone-9 3-methyltransferase